MLQSDSNKEVTVVTRSSSKEECKSMSNPKLFKSVTNRSNEILKTSQNVGRSKISIDVALDKNLASINPQDVLESVDLSSSSSHESMLILHNNVERKTSVELSQAPASVDEVEVRYSVDEVKRTASVDSSADDCLTVDDLDESLGLSRLFAEIKQITWNDVIDIREGIVAEIADNLKLLFKIAHILH